MADDHGHGHDSGHKDGKKGKKGGEKVEPKLAFGYVMVALVGFFILAWVWNKAERVLVATGNLPPSVLDITPTNPNPDRMGPMATQRQTAQGRQVVTMRPPPGEGRPCLQTVNGRVVDGTCW